MITKKSIYAPFGNFIIRIPLMPIEFYQGLIEKNSNKNSNESTELEKNILHQNKIVRGAILLANSKILENFYHGNKNDFNKHKKIRESILRYLIRMSTRPTPFGIFASVGVGNWSSKTDIDFSNKNLYIKAKPDAEWLIKIAAKLESDFSVLESLKLFTNPAIARNDNRVFLLQYLPLENKKSEKEISIGATEAITKVLETAEHGASYLQLANLLTEKYNASRDEIRGLIFNLVSQTFLLTNLRPDLKSEKYIKKLGSLITKKKLKKKLSEISKEIDAFDGIPLEEIEQKYMSLLKKTDSLEDSESRSPLQVDMGIHNCKINLNNMVGEEAAKAAEMLLSISPFQNGSPYLFEYIKKFIEKYGEWGIVPLTEILDPNKGLGTPYREEYLIQYVESSNLRLHDEELLKLPSIALKQHRLSIELDDETINKLRTSELNQSTAPKSLDIYVNVCALSSREVDKGNFKVMVSPITGKFGAGESITRFSHLLNPQIKSFFEEVLKYENTVNKETKISEIFAIPKDLHLLNVAMHEPIYENSITLGTAPDSSPNAISIRDLYIGIKGGKLYIYWSKRRSEIIVKSNSMLNQIFLPDLIRFLLDISESRYPLLHPFDWRIADHLPFLPRIEFNRIILSPAKWNIDSSTFRELDVIKIDTFIKALKKWRDEWLVPRYVYIGFVDNRLLLDLESQPQIELLYSEVKKIKSGKTIEIEEALPSLDQAWIKADEKHFFSEFTVPLKLRDFKQIANKNIESRNRLPISNLRNIEKMKSNQVKPPTSDWLYVKLYLNKDLETDIISYQLREFCTKYADSGIIKNWFFVRYSDPRDHLRLRFNGNPEKLTDTILPEVSNWAKKLFDMGICFGFSIDTYERETERYGGVMGIELAEKVFGVDSNVAVFILRALKDKNTEIEDKSVIAALTADYLLRGLGLGNGDRLALYKKWTNEIRGKFEQNFDSQMNNLSLMLGGFTNTKIGNIPIKELENMIRTELKGVGFKLQKLDSERKLCQDINEIYRSYVHMHFNRLLGVNTEEETSLVLLKRAMETLVYKNSS
jgi:thiopeptide-type bacteriocin biosynthesis protein